MSEGKLLGTERSKTPDDRSNYKGSKNPMESPPKFDTGHTAWLTLGGRRGSFEVEIVSRVKDAYTGQYVYQVKGKEGVLHNGGEWMAQAQLSAR